MGKMVRRAAMILVISMAVLSMVGSAYADKGLFSNVPTTNNGKKWRIGYLEGGPYQNYPMVLKATVRGLVELGWVEDLSFPPVSDPDDTSELWKWLSTNAHSKYIEFVADGFWSANWDDQQRKAIQAEVIKRLNETKDIDLMIAMGTWAGQDLANNQHHTNTLVLSSSDPIASKIVKSVEDSGYAHVHARVDPRRYERQIRVFHDIIGFSRLGVAYENTLPGRTYAAIADIEKVAKERGFEIVRCYTKDDVPDIKVAEESVVNCFTQLAPQVDAVYLTIQRGVNLSNLPKILGPLNKRGIPTFSQGGSEEVKYGVLLSIAQAEFKYEGKFHAKCIAKIFNGAKPNDLDQIFESPSKIAINLATAQLIDYDPAVDILGAADEIYQDIETAQ